MLNNPSPRGDFTPADHGMVAWSYDPAVIASNALIPAGGTLNVVKLKLTGPTLITAVLMICSNPGATLTAGQNFAMVFDETGAQIGVTADQATAWQSTGNKDMPLTAPVTARGPFVTVGLYAVGSTLPGFRMSIASSAVGNVNLATASSRFGTANTGLTTTPPATLGTITAPGLPWWVGLR